MIKKLILNIEALQGLMVAYVTNGREDEQPKEYSKHPSKYIFYKSNINFSFVKK